MATEIHKLIAAINPDVYCSSKTKKKVKEILKRELKEGNERAYLEAAKEAELNKTGDIYSYDKAKKDPFNLFGIKSPTEQHELIYDSATEGLEQVYFWLFDFMKSIGLKSEKIIDNFVSSPGSGHFSELQGKATRMQEEASKALGSVNQVIKSILNIVYDLRDFQMRLKIYDDYNNSKSPDRRNSALLSLKQIWMDTVDATKRGTTSIKGLAQQFDYVTLIDAFMAARNISDVTKPASKGGLDLNERVRRILQQRVGEFFDWIKLSEKELRKRYNIEVNYLRSQYNTVKLYSRWIKPYLVAAKKLEQIEYSQPDLVTAFNTIILQLTLQVKADYGLQDDINNGTMPEVYESLVERKKVRTYIPFFILELKFRGIPQKVGQHYTFGGRAEVKFTSYALNEDELKVLKDQLEKDDVDDVMGLIQGATQDSLEQLQDDIEEFLEEKESKKNKKPKKKVSKKEEDLNPFTALFSFFKREEKSDNPLIIKPDTDYEKVLRSQASIVARERSFLVFEVYKKAHGMPSYDTPFDPI